MCDVDLNDFNNSNYHCTYLKSSDLQHIALHGTEDGRKQYYQHQVANTFHDINFGGQDYRLLCSILPDILTVIRKGIIE